jgi:DNA-binding HxlR family transcriptional regulator
MAREYGQFCGLAHALDLVGGRWSLLIVRDLLSGPKRFKDLEESLKGIPTNVLSGRLRELEESGVIRRHLLPRPSSGVAYELTDYGHELEVPLVELGLWGAKSLGHPKAGEALSVPSLWLALLAAFRSEGAASLDMVYELRFPDRSLLISVQRGQLSIVTESAVPDLVLSTSPETLVALLARQLRFDDAVATGELEMKGSKAEARRFFKLFYLPVGSTGNSS